MVKRWSVGQSHFQVVRRVPRVRPRFFPESFLVMKTTITITTSPIEMNEEQGWNRNTDLAMDVKTFLRTDRITKIGKGYPGILTRDREDHYRFIETLCSISDKRNPRVFVGEFITVTRRDDGSLRPNFKPIKVDAGFNVDSYAIGVCNELRLALNGLLEE